MAYTAPRTWVTGEVVTAVLMNTHIRDNLNAIASSSGLLKKVAGGLEQSISSGDKGTILSALSSSGNWGIRKLFAGGSSGTVKKLYGGLERDLTGANKGTILSAISSSGQWDIRKLFSAGSSSPVKHEYGGIEADISAVAGGGILRGSGAGSISLLAMSTGDKDKVLTASSSGTDVKWKLGGATKELWVPIANFDSQKGKYPTQFLQNSGDDGIMSFHVPNDFSSITEAVVLVIPLNTGTENWDIFSDYAADGEAFQTNSESDTTTTYSATADQMLEVDISGILSAIAVGDYVGIHLTLGGSADDAYVVGLRFKYA